MKKRPLVFSLQAWIFILLAISFPLQIIFKEDLGIHSWHRAFYLLTPLNWLTLITFILLTCLSFKASPLLKIALPLSFTLVAINNFVAMDVLGEKAVENFMFNMGPATVAYSLFLYFVMFKSQQAYVLENPHLRWWRLAPRYQMSLPLWFAQKGMGLQHAQTFDLAAGGIFVPMDVSSHADVQFRKGETLQIHLDLMGQVLQCRGKLARIEKSSKGTYPPGLGIQLDVLDYSKSSILNKFLKGLAPDQSMAHWPES